MKTSLIYLLFLSAFAYGQFKEPLGMERYFNQTDSSSSFHFDVFPNESALFTFILYDSLDGQFPEYNLDLVWIEFNRVIDLNAVKIENFGLIVTKDYGEPGPIYSFSIFDLIRGFEHEQLKTIGFPEEDELEVVFGFQIEQDGWFYSIYVLDEYIYTTVETTDLATIRKLEKKYPDYVNK